MANILLVEDEPDIAFIIQAWLAHDCHQVECVDNGAEALKKIKKQVYDVVLLDWLLPDITGIEICRTIRELGLRTPLLMLTSQGGIDNKVEALDIGIDDYLVKPCALQELSARVRALLRRPACVQPNTMPISLSA